MPNTTYGSPYAQSSDLVSNWPGVSLNVADRIDDVSFKRNGLNDQTGTTYTLVLTDAGKTVTLNNASAVTVTVPTNASVAYETGTCIYLTNKGAGLVTVSAAGGVTLNNSLTLAQYASAYIQKLDTNTWVMVSGATASNTLITSGTLTGSSVVLSSIPATYLVLRLVVRNYKPATDNTPIGVRLNGDTGGKYTQIATDTAGANPTSTSMVMSYGSDNTVANGHMMWELFDYANTVTIKTMRGYTVVNNATTTTIYGVVPNYVGLYNSTAAISSITLLPDSGNFTSGDYLLYGVK